METQVHTLVSFLFLPLQLMGLWRRYSPYPHVRRFPRELLHGLAALGPGASLPMSPVSFNLTFPALHRTQISELLRVRPTRTPLRSQSQHPVVSCTSDLPEELVLKLSLNEYRARDLGLSQPPPKSDNDDDFGTPAAKDQSGATEAARGTAGIPRSAVACSALPATAPYIGEFRLMAQLPPHPHVMQCFGWGYEFSFAEENSSKTVHPDDVVRPFGLLPWKEGITDLRVWLQRNSAGEEEKTAILTGLLEGLHFLHAHGVAHRDVKPDNVLIQPQNRERRAESDWIPMPLLADFGEAVASVNSPVWRSDIDSSASSRSSNSSPTSLEGGHEQRIDFFAVSGVAESGRRTLRYCDPRERADHELRLALKEEQLRRGGGSMREDVMMAAVGGCIFQWCRRGNTSVISF